ncbi:hypothetical protein LRM35_18295 [Klebsiella variicola subsp. variicola]|nr:hypothetical protein LRM35_18295 [Klebsiella variicola subsp. variicola]
MQSGMGSVLSTLIVLGAGLLGTLGWYGPIYLYALAIPVFIGLCLFTAEPALRHRADNIADEKGVAFSAAQNGGDRPDYPWQRNPLLSRAAADKPGVQSARADLQ